MKLSKKYLMTILTFSLSLLSNLDAQPSQAARRIIQKIAPQGAASFLNRTYQGSQMPIRQRLQQTPRLQNFQKRFFGTQPSQLQIQKKSYATFEAKKDFEREIGTFKKYLLEKPSPSEAKKAYKNITLQIHPDRYDQKLKVIANEAMQKTNTLYQEYQNPDSGFENSEYDIDPITINFFEAIDKGYKAIAKLLIDGGADVNARDHFGYTPLHIAIRNYRNMASVDIVKLLIKNSANVDAKDSDGNTPLHYAAIFDSRHIAELLIDDGADVNARNNDGNTPLHIAKKNARFSSGITAKYLKTVGGYDNIFLEKLKNLMHFLRKYRKTKKRNKE